MKNETEIKHEVGSGNVFKDLGLPNPERELLKSQLTLQINQEIKERRLTQQQAAKLLGCDQPEISKLQHGRYYRFRVERLLEFLNRLGLNTNIVISKAKPKTQPEQKVIRHSSLYGNHCGFGR